MTSAKVIQYYPKGEGTYAIEPAVCRCGASQFKKIAENKKQFIRHHCQKCKTSYMVPFHEKTATKLRRAGNILDNVVFGISSRDNSLKIFIDTGDDMSHQTILNRMEEYIPLIKMFTDDVLCCLKYGDTWGIDETMFDIRGEEGKPDEERVKESRRLATQYAKLRRSGKDAKKISEAKKEAEKARAREVSSAKRHIHRYLTAIIDLKTRVIIHYIITDRRPDTEQIYGLLSTATLVAGVPSNITTDQYPAYKSAVKKLEKNMQHGNRGSVRHINIRAKNQSTLHYTPKKSTGDIPMHNNYIESTWAKIKKNAGHVSGYTDKSYDSLIHYYIIHYNFMNPHGACGEFSAKRHDNTRRLNRTPVMNAGYPHWLATFEEVICEAWGYDKSFVFKLGQDLLKNVRMGIRGKFMTISAKKKTKKDVLYNLDRTLQVFCGFSSDPKKNQWRRLMPSMSAMYEKRSALLADVIPEKTFEVCYTCGVVGTTTQEVHNIFGYRRSNGKMITQPNCKICRIQKTNSPRKKIGPNKKKMITGPIMFGRQLKLD